MNKPIHREEYRNNAKHVYCIGHKINKYWLTTDDNEKVTCRNCLKSIHRKNEKRGKVRVQNTLQPTILEPDVKRAVSLLKKPRAERLDLLSQVEDE